MTCHSVCGSELSWIGGTFNRCYHTVLFKRIHGEECGITQEPLDLLSSYLSLLVHTVIEVLRCLETQDEFYFKNGLCQARIGIDMSHPCYQLRVPSADIDKVLCPIPTYFFLCAFLYLVLEFTLPKLSCVSTVLSCILVYCSMAYIIRFTC